MSARYAIYYAPPAGHPLSAAGATWIGRDATSGSARLHPVLPGVEVAEMAAATTFPRFYGFHATLKAPFNLSAGLTQDALITAADAFAARWARFNVSLAPNALGPFLALTESAPSLDLTALHADALGAFEPFRAPLSEADLARRGAASLSSQEQAYLERWGYPYVLERFKFHMTLTGALEDDARARLLGAAHAHFASVVAAPVPVDSICVFAQPEREAAFTLLHRAVFAPA